MTKFTEEFPKYACEGDEIECESEGFTIIARILHDTDYRIDDDDMHNIDQSVTGCDDEQQEKLLAARQAWFTDEWFYCGIVLSVTKNGIVLDDHATSVWGMECNYPDSDNSHLNEAVNELLSEAIDVGQNADIAN